MRQAIEQRVRELVIAQLYHLETYERLMDHFEDNEGDQLDEAINKIARETMYAPDLLAACEAAFEMAEYISNTYGRMVGDTSKVQSILSTAIAKAKGDQCSV